MERYFERVHDASVAHLAQTRETYAQHAFEALTCSWWLLCAAIAAFIHAFVPGVFTSTASSIAAHIVRSVAARHQRGVMPDDAPKMAH